MKRFAMFGALLALAAVLGWGSSSALRSDPGTKVGKAEDQNAEAAADRAPPGLKKGVKIDVHYAGRNDETWTVEEVKGNWVRISFQGGEYWANFDNVVYYSFKN
jgi:hypothetical protein